MNYWYLAGSAVAAMMGFGGYLYRRYRNSLGSSTQTFRAFVIGTVKLRVGAVFSTFLTSQLAAKRYAELSRRRFSSQLSVPSMQNIKLPIDRMYVQLSVTTGKQSKLTDNDLLRPNTQGSILNSVLILGEPGSGKSTLTKKLFRDACMSLYRSPSYAPLPVHVELRSLPWLELDDAVDSGEWLQSKLVAEVDSVQGVHSDGFIFRSFSTGRGILLILDGLDEVPSQVLAKACSAISALGKKLTGLGAARTRMIVTGRLQLRSTLPRSFTESFDEIAIVDPFSSADVFDFLLHWPYPSNSRLEASRIFRAIQASSSLQEMCTNPLVLSMYVARDQLYVLRSGTRPVRLPDTRTDFYKEIVGELLIYRRGEQVEASAVGSKLRRQREQALGSAALSHLLDDSQPANSIPWNIVVESMGAAFKIADQQLAETELRKLSIETGILSEERQAESARFLHLTLCEFLAATEVREAGPNGLGNLATNFTAAVAAGEPGRLREVFVFAASLVGRAERRDLLAQMFDGDSSLTTVALRIMYETNEYSDSTLEKATEKVVQLAGEHPSPQHIEDVRLLMLCLRDSEGAAGHDRSGDPTRLRELVRSLVDVHRVPFSLVLFPLLRIDTSLAMNQVRERECEHLLTPDALLSVLDDPLVVEYAIVDFIDCEGRWAVPLAEAALRYRLVAEMLHASTYPSLNAPDLPDRSSTGDQVSNPAIDGTTYGAVLDAALRMSFSDELAPRLSALKALRVLEFTEPKALRDVRGALNLEDRHYLASRRGEFFCIIMGDGPDAEVWGHPTIRERGRLTTRDLLTNREFDLIRFGPATAKHILKPFLAHIINSCEPPLRALTNVSMDDNPRYVAYSRFYPYWLRRRIARIRRR